MDVRSAIDRIIRREARIFGALCAIAIAAFFATRTLAASNRRTAQADAARWNAAGAASLAAGNAKAAVDAFRKASLIDRDNRAYRSALADALRRTGDNDAALDVLLRLREAVPEDVEVNASLARLVAARGSVDDAVRYFQTAILGLWQPARIEERRTLRIELIDLLLTHGAAERALAELLKLSGEIPDDPLAHVRVGQLLMQAGSPARAEAQFVAALRRAPHDETALAGAGEAAFATGDYEHARDYLRRTAGGADSERLQIAELVLDIDPLLPRLTARERDRRLARAVDELQARAAGCASAAAPQQALADLQRTFAAAHATSADSLGPDLARVAGLARDLSNLCPPPQPIDRAIVLIAARHGLDAS
ncbi:MAG TPA: tetratricopeptide repeat protein [Vicinamibacterales bacterium]